MHDVSRKARTPGNGHAVQAARREFLHAVIHDVPEVGDGLTQRLEALPLPRTHKRVGQEIAAWARDIELPHALAIEGISGFDLFVSPSERGDEGWGGLIAYEWLQGEWYDEEEQHRAAFGKGVRVRSISPIEDPGEPSLETGSFRPSPHEGADLRDVELDDLEKEIRTAFNGELRAWLKDRRALDRVARGLRKVRARQSTRARRGGLTDAEQDRRRHFVWYARFQCLGETQALIAKTAGVTAQTVGDAVRAIADEADLPLRTGGKRGNPRKKKASRS